MSQTIAAKEISPKGRGIESINDEDVMSLAKYNREAIWALLQADTGLGKDLAPSEKGKKFAKEASSKATFFKEDYFKNHISRLVISDIMSRCIDSENLREMEYKTDWLSQMEYHDNVTSATNISMSTFRNFGYFDRMPDEAAQSVWHNKTIQGMRTFKSLVDSNAKDPAQAGRLVLSFYQDEVKPCNTRWVGATQNKTALEIWLDDAIEKDQDGQGLSKDKKSAVVRRALDWGDGTKPIDFALL